MNPIKRYFYEWKTIHRYRMPVVQAYLYVKDLIWTKWKAGDLKRAIRLANERCKQTGKTHYVLPDENGRPRAFSTNEIELMKRVGMMSKRANCYHLFKNSLYVARPKEHIYGVGKSKR